MKLYTPSTLKRAGLMSLALLIGVGVTPFYTMVQTASASGPIVPQCSAGDTALSRLFVPNYGYAAGNPASVELAAYANGCGDTITSYAWDFGDGNTTTTASSSQSVSATHAYAPGTYTVQVTMTDAANQTSTSEASLTVRATNTAPSIAPTLNLAMYVDEQKDIDFNTYVSDSDGDQVTVYLGDYASVSDGKLSIRSLGDNQYTVSARYDAAGDGSATYTFDYQARDTYGASTTGTIHLEVKKRAPIAVDDSVTTGEDQAGVFNLTANDQYAQYVPTEIVILSQPAHGTLQASSGAYVTYTPDANYHGPDAFTYALTNPYDRGGLSAPATVSVDVTAVNDAPVVPNVSATVVEDGSVAVDLLAGASDVEGDALHVTSVEPSQYGASVVLNSDGTLTYTPAANATTSEQLWFDVSDGQTTQRALLTVNVTPVNDPVTITNATVRNLGAKTVGLDVALSDVDNSQFTYTVNWGDGTTSTYADRGANVSLSHGYQKPNRTYTVTVTVSDGAGSTATRTLQARP